MAILQGSAQHVGARSSQQDAMAFWKLPDSTLLAVVCDGMGGMEKGDVASDVAARAFVDAYRRKPLEEPIPEALQRSANQTNFAVFSLAKRLDIREGMGTTLLAVVVDRNEFHYLSVGDSGLFHISRGRLKSVNRRHIFANFLDSAAERGAITGESAKAHPGRDLLTSFIGTQNLEEVDSSEKPIHLRRGDTVLLATDGLFNTLSLDEIQAAIQADPKTAPDRLIEWTLAKRNKIQDNVTVVTLTMS
jgi:PPM family protein phosphatase